MEDKIEEINARLKGMEAALMTFINTQLTMEQKQEFLKKMNEYLSNINNNISPK